MRFTNSLVKSREKIFRFLKFLFGMFQEERILYLIRSIDAKVRSAVWLKSPIQK